MDEKKIKIRKFRKKWNSIINIVKNLSDSELTDYLDTNDFENFIRAFFDASKIKRKEIIADFLLKNKNKSQAVALIHQLVNTNCVLRKKINGFEGVVSPSYNQKDEDEVIFLESSNGKSFEGLIGSYDGVEAKYAVAGTDMRKDDKVNFSRLIFLSIDEFRKRIKEQNLKENLSDLKNAKLELLKMLKNGVQDESRYQEFFIKNPWIFGLQYKQIDRHTNLDDERIPDFTGVRIKDGHRDIFEIKQPFLKLFNQDSKFCSNFNNAINQAEEYRRYSNEQKSCLYEEKGLLFENPESILILGYDMDDNDIKKIKNKEKSTTIKILSYNDILSYIDGIVNFSKNISK